MLSASSGEQLARAQLSGPHPPALKATGLAIAPDGRTIAVNRVTHVELWRLALEGNVADALRLKTVLLLPVTARVDCPVPVAFSADGGRLAAGCDSAVVWDLATRREVLRLVPDAEGRIGGVPAWIDEGFAFSADGQTILTTHGVWDVPEAASTRSGQARQASGAIFGNGQGAGDQVS